MNTRNFQKLPLTIFAFTLLALTAGNAVAQNSTTPAPAQPAAAPAAPQLSYGVPEVLQLVQAKVSDSTVIAYIQNSGNNYGLNAAQIIYLRQQGVSEAVLNTMLNQRAQSAQSAPAATASAPDSPATYSSQTSTAPPPAVTYVQSAPASTVYVIPDTQTYYYNNWLYYHSPYYGNYPYYGYYYPYPAVSVSFGWGGGWGGRWGGWHGGGGGGWHGGGGFHGGGGWHH